MIQKNEASTHLQIRPCTEADIPTLATIAAESFSDPWSERMFMETWSAPYNTIWCSIEDSKIIGYLVLSKGPDAYTIEDIAVLPAFRRRGIGYALLQFVLQEAPEKTYWLEVRTSNQAAQNLYRRSGFIEVGRRKAYYDQPIEDAVLMTRSPT